MPKYKPIFFGRQRIYFINIKGPDDESQAVKQTSGRNKIQGKEKLCNTARALRIAKIQAYGSLKAKMIINHQIQLVKKMKKIK